MSLRAGGKKICVKSIVQVLWGQSIVMTERSRPNSVLAIRLGTVMTATTPTKASTVGEVPVVVCSSQ